MSEKKIKIVKDGPYIVTGNVDLSEKIIRPTDDETRDEQYVWRTEGRSPTARHTPSADAALPANIRSATAATPRSVSTAPRPHPEKHTWSGRS